MSKVELDKIDRKILEVLQNNGRLTNLEVAERVNLSPSPCLRRIRRLEESGVIRQYAALLDPGKIGLGLSAYINVRLEKQGGAPKGKAPGDIFRHVARGGHVLRHDRRDGLPAQGVRGRHGPLCAVHPRPTARPPGGD